VEVQVLSAALVRRIVLIVTFGLWVLMAGFSYLFVNKAVISMLLPSHPEYGRLINIVDWGNNNRYWLCGVFAGIVGLLTVLQLWWLKRENGKNWSKKMWIGVMIIELMAVLSYNFISDDLYSYLYSGKMVVEYKVNPYTVMPKEFFGRDQWLFFVKNVNNVYYHLGDTGITYYYGPLFLAYTSIFVKLVGPGRFVALYLGWKTLNLIWFMLAGWILMRLIKDRSKVMALWYFNPLLQFEMLTNNHNDLMMIGLFFGSLMLITKNKLNAVLTALASTAIKFVSVIGWPILLIKEKYREVGFFIMGFVVVLFHAVKPLHLWYYSWLYLFWPMARLKTRTWILLFLFQGVMLINYSGYIWFNRWTGAPFLPPIGMVRWMLLLLLLVSEWERILKINLLKYKYF
jgi:hypothetical protein